MVGGIRHGQVAIDVQPVGEEVVEHAAVLAAEHAVLRAAHPRAARFGDRELGEVVREQPLEQVERLRPACFDLAHVRHVENAAAPAHSEMLLAQAPVFDRHLPARELH